MLRSVLWLLLTYMNSIVRSSRVEVFIAHAHWSVALQVRNSMQSEALKLRQPLRLPLRPAWLATELLISKKSWTPVFLSSPSFRPLQTSFGRNLVGDRTGRGASTCKGAGGESRCQVQSGLGRSTVRARSNSRYICCKCYPQRGRQCTSPRHGQTLNTRI